MQPAGRTSYVEGFPAAVNELIRTCPECGDYPAVSLGRHGHTHVFLCVRCGAEFERLQQDEDGDEG